jgi:glycosyltransferase involved in cell wall biosynthesis
MRRSLATPDLAVIIPALDEEACVGQAVASIPAGLAAEIIVVDNGSTDHTAEAARAAGARVVREVRRGYGYACQAGVEATRAALLVFMDADGSCAGDEIPLLLEPLLAGRADLVQGSRGTGLAQRGALLPHQRFGNRLGCWLVRLLFGVRLGDLGPFRAIRRAMLADLHMTERTYGWPMEMTARAARSGYRIIEVPVRCRVRLAGRSKVAGTLRGSVMAGWHIIGTALKVARCVGAHSRGALG